MSFFKSSPRDKALKTMKKAKKADVKRSVNDFAAKGGSASDFAKSAKKKEDQWNRAMKGKVGGR